MYKLSSKSNKKRDIMEIKISRKKIILPAILILTTLIVACLAVTFNISDFNNLEGTISSNSQTANQKISLAVLGNEANRTNVTAATSASLQAKYKLSKTSSVEEVLKYETSGGYCQPKINKSTIDCATPSREYSFINFSTGNDFIKDLITQRTHIDGLMVVISSQNDLDSIKEQLEVAQEAGIKDAIVVLDDYTCMYSGEELDSFYNKTIKPFFNEKGFNLNESSYICLPTIYYNEIVDCYSDDLTKLMGYADTLFQATSVNKEKSLLFDTEDYFNYQGQTVLCGELKSGKISKGDNIAIVGAKIKNPNYTQAVDNLNKAKSQKKQNKEIMRLQAIVDQTPEYTSQIIYKTVNKVEQFRKTLDSFSYTTNGSNNIALYVDHIDTDVVWLDHPTVSEPGSLGLHKEVKVRLYYNNARADEGGNYVPLTSNIPYSYTINYMSAKSKGQVTCTGPEIILPGESTTATISLDSELALEKGSRISLLTERGESAGYAIVTEIIS